MSDTQVYPELPLCRLPAHIRAPHRALWLGLYLACLSLLSGFVVTRHVSAELGERALSVGRQLGSFQELRGRTTELVWNGQELALSTSIVEQPVSRVLGRFIALCDASSKGVASELATSLGQPGTRSLLARSLVLHDLFDDGTGSAVCLSGLGESGLSGLTQRARRFAKSWDLSELGQLRYAFVRALGPARTQILLVSASGSLSLRQLLALDGRDVPGSELVTNVRPAQSSRILSARTQGGPEAITAYRSQLSVSAVLSDYDQQLLARGFTRTLDLRAPAQAGEALTRTRQDATEASDEAPSVTYRRAREVLVVATQATDDGSLLTVVQLAR